MEDTIPPRSRRWRIAVLAVLGIVAAYAVIVALVVPPIARKLIADKGGEALGRVVVLDELHINPFTLDATARGFRILEADRTTPFVSFETLDIAGSATSLYRFAPIVDAVTLTGLKVNLVRDAPTHYNLSDIVQRLAAKPAAKKGSLKSSRSATCASSTRASISTTGRWARSTRSPTSTSRCPSSRTCRAT
jgi:uncharacterized protein involved in outer membrane biogenesis